MTPRPRPGGPRVALVTGGARRIGAAVSRALARAEFSVVLTYRESGSEARSLAREIGGRARHLDLALPGAISRLAASIEREEGRLDLLVNNAAVFPRTPVGSVSAGDWDRVFDVNLRGPFLLTQRLLPLLRRAPGGGAVLFFGDAGAGRLWPAHLPYCLSKLALEEQARAWRKVLSPEVRVGIVRPGLALIPPGFPRAAWERLRSREGRGQLDSPAKVVRAVLRFARGGGYNPPQTSRPRRDRTMPKWRCIVCDYVYDPAAGDPENGVDPGTPFESIPDDWVCPLCSAGKDEFETVEG